MRKRVPLFLLFLLLTLLWAEENTFVKVNVNRANIRSAPSVKSKVLGTAKAGETFKFLNSTGKWYKIIFKGEKAFIHSSVAKKIVVKTKAQETPTQVIQKREKPKTQSVSKTPTTVSEKDLKMLKKIAVSMRKNSLAFLQIIKEMNIVKEKPTIMTVEKVKILNDGCNVYETKDERSRVIFNPRYNDEYEIVERYENLYKIKLKDGREGWINEKDVQIITEQIKTASYRAKGLTQSEINEYISVAEDIYSQIVQQKAIADKIFEKYKRYDLNTSQNGKELLNVYQRIEKYFNYADNFFKMYIESGKIAGKMTGEILKRISAWGELLLGPSNYSTEYHDEYLSTENKGIVSNLNLSANTIINKNSKAELNFSKLNDIIQTPYSTTDLSFRYSYDNKKNLGIGAALQLNTYTDKSDESTGLNDYTRTGFLLNSKYLLNKDTRFLVNFSHTTNSYKNNEDNNFSTNKINAKAEHYFSNFSRVYANFMGLSGSSDSAFHDYGNMQTEIGYATGKINSTMKLSFSYETLNYSKMETSNYNIFKVGIYKNSRNSLKYSYYYLDYISKTFSNNNAESYNQIKGAYSYSKYGKHSKNFLFSFFTNLYKEQPDFNFTEARFEIGSISSALFLNFSGFLKFWHSPESENSTVVKPHVVDFYGKTGINTGIFRIGPTVGVHFLISSEEGESLIKRDGNLFRFGGMIEGNINFGTKSFLNFRGAYEYGFVYNNELTVNPYTGEITRGELLQRHPTSLQLSFIFSTPLPFYNGMNFIVKGNYYKIATDMNREISINPILENKMLKIIAGISFRYN